MVLTDQKIRNTKLPKMGRLTLTDGMGLQLRITSKGIKTWSLQYRCQGQMLKLTIGKYPDIKLKDARIIASKARLSIAQGRNPQNAKARTKKSDILYVGNCFDEFSKRYLSQLKTGSENIRAFKHDVLPYIAHKNLKSIEKYHLIKIIDKVADRGALILANRLLQYMKKFFSWCVGRGYLEHNPALYIPKPAREQSRDNTLSLDEIRSLYKATYELKTPFGQYVRLLILTGQRKNEIARLTWNEYLNDRLEIPSIRSKNGKPILTPLPSKALEVLASIPSNDGLYIFSTTNGLKPLSCFTQIKEKLKKMSDIYGWTFHDFRRSMATILEDEGVDRFSIKCLLNHTDHSVTGIYDRSEHIRRKTIAIDHWSNLIISEIKPKNNVINMRKII